MRSPLSVTKSMCAGQCRWNEELPAQVVCNLLGFETGSPRGVHRFLQQHSKSLVKAA